MAPIIAYFALSMLLPVIFYFARRNYIWFSIPLAIIIEVAVYWDHFAYYESRGLMLLLTAVQFVVMLLNICIIRFVILKLNKSSVVLSMCLGIVIAYGCVAEFENGLIAIFAAMFAPTTVFYLCNR